MLIKFYTRSNSVYFSVVGFAIQNKTATVQENRDFIYPIRRKKIISIPLNDSVIIYSIVTQKILDRIIKL